MNEVLLIGNLTHTPDLKYTKNSKAYTTLQLAVDKYGYNKTQFINIKAWAGQAEVICKYCSKGSKIAVKGAILTYKFKNDNGQTIYFTEVNAENVELLKTSNNNNIDNNKEEDYYEEIDNNKTPF